MSAGQIYDAFWTITNQVKQLVMDMFDPPHPGEILRGTVSSLCA